MTKSNVYRYFENREALPLALLEEESVLWQYELGKRLGGLDHATAEQIAQAYAASSAAYPLMCRPLSILPSILERNVSAERLAAFKADTLVLAGNLAQQLHRCKPSIPVEGYVAFFRQSLALTIGLWPLSQPGEALAHVLQQPELAPLRYDFETDLASGLLLLLRGLESPLPDLRA